jgi:hypothetical protein
MNTGLAFLMNCGLLTMAGGLHHKLLFLLHGTNTIVQVVPSLLVVTSSAQTTEVHHRQCFAASLVGLV